MLFNSFEFLVFFPIVTALYFAVPLRLRWVLLLVASSTFYMAFIPRYILIIYATIIVDYFAGLVIERSEGRRRRFALIASLVANIGALAVFKYCNFFIDNANAFGRALDLPVTMARWDIILPIGLSFHTFQAMSYTIEVYRGNVRAERNFAVYALYVLFYPQLVAGPIERPQNIIHQLRERHRFDPVRATEGLRLMLWGFFKKVVVADRLAHVVDVVYANPDSWPGPVLVLATVAFAFQIYADFSGYSDIAIGAARIMGIDLMTNFRQPYLARSVSEFWSRWHISLSSWFRDYLYFPLGGNRVCAWRHRFNLMATFVVSGLWHGANWTFVCWGALNGAYLIMERAMGAERGKSLARLLVTFGLISFSWIFFRASSIDEAFRVISGLCRDASAVLHPAGILRALDRADLDWYKLVVAAGGVLVILLVDQRANRAGADIAVLLGRLRALPRWGLYYGAGAAIALLGWYGEQQFIYFQF
ncbi:MAG: MBOAT family protein [Deltaproteobacteria bacterium]|nr:MBOAT family protein [Deltaproteobacteria bacterium]